MIISHRISVSKARQCCITQHISRLSVEPPSDSTPTSLRKVKRTVNKYWERAALCFTFPSFVGILQRRGVKPRSYVTHRHHSFEASQDADPSFVRQRINNSGTLVLTSFQCEYKPCYVILRLAGFYSKTRVCLHFKLSFYKAIKLYY